MEEFWSDDFIQFTRLLAEIATLNLVKKDLPTLSLTMDLTEQEIDDLFERAEKKWAYFKKLYRL